MLGKHCWEIVHGTTAPILHCPTCKVKNSLHRETMELQDGATWSQVTVDPILSREGQCLKYIHTVSDISERRKLEEQLRQGQKMEAIGTLAGGIAHDFNNILNVIIGYTELALLECSEPEMVREHLAEVAKGSERARLLVKQILAFGRKSEHTSHPLQIAQVVKEAITMLRASIPSTIEIKQQLLSDGTIDADPTQIHQVVMNLCTNAYHAMRETGGVLTVVVDEVEIGLDEPNIADLSAGRYLRLTVSDTGGGIDPTVLDKIFEPYFTTKGPGEGSGLGLAVVHGIVKGYNGQIAVTSVPGTGTSFRISLPLTQKAVLPLASETETAIVMGGGKRILFVDDEAQLCSLIGIICAEHGYRASTFCWPLQALEEFEKDPQKFDLVITDMTMPQLNGTEFSRKILALRPDIPIILCTGYSTLIDSEKAAEVGISAYLVKPVTPQQLLMVVQQLLAKQITA